MLNVSFILRGTFVHIAMDVDVLVACVSLIKDHILGLNYPSSRTMDQVVCFLVGNVPNKGAFESLQVELAVLSLWH